MTWTGAVSESALFPEDWGMTIPEPNTYTPIDIGIFGCKDANEQWRASLQYVQGRYHQIIRLKPGVQQVTDWGEGTDENNFCKQISDLMSHGHGDNMEWYMIEAVEAHEMLHVGRMKQALQEVITGFETRIESIRVINQPDEGSAIGAIQGNPVWVQAYSDLKRDWENLLTQYGVQDHAWAGACDLEEDKIVRPKASRMCYTARNMVYPEDCPDCP
jgi:hypothetical protein